MAEISAALAQADDTARASATDIATRLRAATQAPNFILFIETLFDRPSPTTLALSPATRQALGNEELSKPLDAFMKREQLLHVLNDMRRSGTTCFAFVAFAFVALAAGSVPALGFRTPDSTAPWPTEHQRQLRVADSQAQPYAMNYTDEAAQALGVKDGRWEAFEPRSGDMPSLKGGLDGGRPMLILQWRPGQ
jgi:hypothetical protein